MYSYINQEVSYHSWQERMAEEAKRGIRVKQGTTGHQVCSRQCSDQYNEIGHFLSLHILLQSSCNQIHLILFWIFVHHSIYVFVIIYLFITSIYGKWSTGQQSGVIMHAGVQSTTHHTFEVFFQNSKMQALHCILTSTFIRTDVGLSAEMA